ncbi:hypothetical protein [Archangium sp.]|uniref:hypothetical protein n=1 Tax=Archangium sp. TaxID=1872627 RepID=UPI002D4EBB9B|nr:hypothetical protein [Archangium sp.]HYO54430.1 hypothetical protein [Archangium sp.]
MNTRQSQAPRARGGGSVQGNILRLVRTPKPTPFTLLCHAGVLGALGFGATMAVMSPLIILAVKPLLLLLFGAVAYFGSLSPLLFQSGVELDRQQRTARTWRALHWWPSHRREKTLPIPADATIVVRPGVYGRFQVVLEPLGVDLNQEGVQGHEAALALAERGTAFLESTGARGRTPMEEQASGEHRKGLAVVALISVSLGCGMTTALRSDVLARSAPKDSAARSAPAAPLPGPPTVRGTGADCGSPLVTTQAERDEDLTPLAGCERLRGKLSIAHPSTRGLQSLRRAEGLHLASEHARDLSGLSNLRVVGGGGLSIDPPTGLQDLRGLERLTRLIGGLSVVRTEQLVSLGGLEGVREIGREIRIEENARLQDISALGNLRPIQVDDSERQWLVTVHGVSAQRMEEVGNLSFIRIRNNPQLPEEQVRALVARWSRWFKGDVESCGNKGGSPCESTEGQTFPMTPEQIEVQPFPE